jgi:hypothetical protein
MDDTMNENMSKDWTNYSSRHFTHVVLVLLVMAMSNGLLAQQEGAKRPNPQRELPPARAGSSQTIEGWLNDCGGYWRKQEITVGKRTLMCFDLAPYSGQPGHHVFVYQVLEKQVSLLFCSIIYNPPEAWTPMSFRYEKQTDSLSVAVGNRSILSIALTSLWCD